MKKKVVTRHIFSLLWENMPVPSQAVTFEEIQSFF